MALFGKKSKTAQQKAQGAQVRIFIRFACCAYMVYYVIIPMLKTADESDTMAPEWRIGIAVLFIIITAAIAALTVVELVRNWRAGLYRADAYTDDAVDEGDAGAKSPGGEDREPETGLPGPEPMDGSDSDAEDEYDDDDEYDEYDDEYNDEYNGDEDDGDDNEDINEKK